MNFFRHSQSPGSDDILQWRNAMRSLPVSATMSRMNMSRETRVLDIFQSRVSIVDGLCCKPSNEAFHSFHRIKIRASPTNNRHSCRYSSFTNQFHPCNSYNPHTLTAIFVQNHRIKDMEIGCYAAIKKAHAGCMGFCD
jgi:hypothetical protein